jgi:hypothetical protein
MNFIDKCLNTLLIINYKSENKCQGLDALHQSFIGAHGCLTSASCLISDRWELKITDYGMDLLRVHQPAVKRSYFLKLMH